MHKVVDRGEAILNIYIYIFVCQSLINLHLQVLNRQ